MIFPSIELALAAAQALAARPLPAVELRFADAEDPPVPVVARLASAREQLRHGLALRFARRGSAQAASPEHGVAALQAVRAYFPDDRAAGAEGAFRAGELLRAMGEDERAKVEFRAAEDLGLGTQFRARARLEIAHAERRVGRRARALDLFLAVTADDCAERRWRDEAALWTGRVYAEMARLDDARRWLRQVAENAEDPLARIRAFDAWAITYLDAGDPEGAAGTLGACHRALAETAAEETELGARTRAALERMACVRRLREAVAQRRAR